MDEKNLKERRELYSMGTDSDARIDNNVMRHEYRLLSDAEKIRMKQIKDLGRQFAELLDELGDSRETALARTKIEEAVMWAVKRVTS